MLCKFYHVFGTYRRLNADEFISYRHFKQGGVRFRARVVCLSRLVDSPRLHMVKKVHYNSNVSCKTVNLHKSRTGQAKNANL